MRLFPAHFGPRKRDEDEDIAPPRPETEASADVFRLIPPRAERVEPSERLEPVEPPVSEPEPEPEPPAPAPETGRNVRAVGAMDLTRLSIDNDGRLYWDGKPVEVRRRLMMSPAQVLGATLITLLVLVAAAGAAVVGASTAHEWGCRLGWVDFYCARPEAQPAPPPAPRFDIPA
jgi:hypothetical protein